MATRPATVVDEHAMPARPPSRDGATRDLETLADCYRLVGATNMEGDPVVLAVDGGRIVESVTCDGVLSAEGQVVVAAFIDSHVHLAYFPREQALLQNGIAAAVDLAAPMAFFDHDVGDLQLLRSGPMLTARRGYPTQSWGADGYGLECDDIASCVAAADTVLDAGARLIKIPIGSSPELEDATLTELVEHVHDRGALVIVHALSSAAAERGAEAGADVLAHTPTGRLTDRAVALWSERAVVSTLSAFGGSAPTVDNLRRLRAAGTQVFYGTDLGNTSTAGIDARELELLVTAGLDTNEILTSATSAPAAFFGFEGLGSLDPGQRASFLLVSPDARDDATLLAHPNLVVIDGLAR